MEFWSRYHRPTRKDAEEIVGDRRPGYTNVTATLACYACNKAVAMEQRAKGNIASAEVYERHCDMVYDRLPEDLKW
jgi:hypothetical protein